MSCGPSGSPEQLGGLSINNSTIQIHSLRQCSSRVRSRNQKFIVIEEYRVVEPNGHGLTEDDPIFGSSSKKRAQITIKRILLSIDPAILLTLFWPHPPFAKNHIPETPHYVCSPLRTKSLDKPFWLLRTIVGQTVPLETLLRPPFVHHKSMVDTVVA